MNLPETLRANLPEKTPESRAFDNEYLISEVCGSRTYLTQFVNKNIPLISASIGPVLTV